MTCRSRVHARKSWFCVSMLALSLTLPCPSASAEQPDVATPDQRRAAQKMFEAGDELYESGRYAEAAQAYRASHGTFASPNSRLMLARSLRELGKLAEAYDEFAGTVQDAEASAGRYHEAEHAARGERSALAARLAFVTVKLGSQAPRVDRFEVAGRQVKATRLGSPVAVTPGRTIVLVRLADGSVRERALVLERAQQVTVDLSEASVGPAPTPKTRATVPPARPEPKVADPGPPTDSGFGLRTAAYVAGGVGVLGAAGFAAFGLLDRATYRDLEASCPDGQCPLDRESDIDKGRRYQLLANVSLGVVAVGVAASTVLFLLSPSEEAAPGTVAICVQPTSFSVEGKF